MSGKVLTWSRLSSCETVVAAAVLVTFKPAGALKENPCPCTATGFSCGDPPQPARMTAANARSARLHQGFPGISRSGTTRKERDFMAKTKDKVVDAAENVKPYVDRAIGDEKLRADVMSAINTARDLYSELVGDRRAVSVAARVATDDEIRDKLKD